MKTLKVFSFFKEKDQKIVYIIVGGKVIYKYYKKINEQWLLKDEKRVFVLILNFLMDWLRINFVEMYIICYNFPSLKILLISNIIWFEKE